MKEAGSQVGRRRALSGVQADDDVTDTEISRVVAVVQAIGVHAPLRELLRDIAGVGADTAFAVSQPNGDAWLTVRGSRVAATRDRPVGVAVVSADSLRRHADPVSRELHVALSGTEILSEAARLVAPLLLPASIASRREIAALLPLAPAIEQIAYKTAASLAVTLDLVRPHLLAALDEGSPLRPGVLADYWQRVHAMGQCVLLASDPAARPWLSEMARQFSWKIWTPTFTLLRERTTWLAACAARSAVAFGEPVIEAYLDTLRRATHPFKIFDALFGLSAIAIADRSLAPAIATELRLARRFVTVLASAEGYVERMYGDALQLIEGGADWAGPDAPEIEALGWTASTGLATDLALRTDPASIVRSGHFLGFVVLPTVLATKPELFFPRDRRVEGTAPGAGVEEMVAAVLQGAWSSSPRADRVVH